MPGAQDQDTVKTLSYTPTSGNGEAASASVKGSVDDKTSPISVAPIATPRTNSPPRSQASQSTNPFGDSDGEESSPPPPGEALNCISGTLSSGSPETTSTISGVVGSVSNGSKEPIYATIDQSTKKSPQKSLDGDSGVDKDKTEDSFSSAVSEYDEPWDNGKTQKDLEEKLSERLSNNSGTSSTFSPSGSYDADSKAGSDTPLITPSKRTNRFWPRAKYAMQQKGFVISTVSATFITLYLAAYAGLALLQNKGMFIAFITNNPKFLTVPGIIALSLFAIGIACAVKKFYNTVEHQIEEKNPNKILDKVLELHSGDEIVKSLTLKYINNTYSRFQLNVWQSSKNGFANPDKEVIRKTGKIESVINDRPLFTALFTGIIVANIALPLGLYAAGGMHNVQMFYQSLLTTNIGLLAASSVLALSILCLGVHYYNKTNCNNFVYLQDSETSNDAINKKLFDETQEKRIPALGKNHKQSGKCSSVTVEQAIFKFHTGPDFVCNFG